MPKPTPNPRSKAIGYVTSNDDKASSPSNNAFVLFLLLLLLLLLGVVLLNIITEFLSLLLSLRKVVMRVLRLPGREWSRAKREEDVSEEREEVVAVTKEEVNIIIIIITTECLLFNCFDDFFLLKKPHTRSMMMNVDKSPKNEEEFSLFATSQKKFHSKAALEYSFRIEEMFTTTPMNALFLRPPLSPPPPHATRISSQKRSSNATFRRTTTLCVTPRATASSSSSSTSSTTSTTNNNSVVNKKKIIVKVQPQQTLSIVSKENGISIPDIVRLNGLGTRRTLQVGEELIVSDFEGNVGDADVGYKIIERAKMTTMMITSSTDEEKTTVEKEKEIVSSSSPSTTSPTDEKTTEEKEQNVKKILRLVPENAKEAIMRKIERLKVETTNKSDASTASLIQVVPRSVTASVPFTTSFGVGVGAAVLSMALVATNIGRDGKGKEEKEEEEKKEVGFEVESSGISSSSSSTRDSNSSNEEIEAVSVETKLVEKEVAEEVKVTTPLPTVEVVEEKEDVVEVGRSESSPAPLERLKGWMDERDAQENFESSIEEFKAKLAAAQDALIVLQDQLEQSKRKKNSQK